MFTRLALVGVFLALVAAVSGAVWHFGQAQALDRTAARGRADLALASDRLVARLQRYQELAVLTADHPVLAALAQGRGDPAGAAALLLELADKTSALTLVFADPKGRVLARSGTVADPGALGQSPHFARALQGANGRHHEVIADGRRVFHFAAPHFDTDGKVRGVLVAVADVERVEWEWRGERATMFFVDDAQVVFVSNRSELLLRRRDTGGLGAGPDGPALPVAHSTRAGHRIWRQDWGPYVPAIALHVVQPLPVIGLTAEALVDLAPARRLALYQALAVAGVLLTFGALLFLATERRRALAQANAALELRVAERTRALSATNEALQRAQADLVQAGKLSALGQMSAGISHELNQPLMAIDQFAANAAQFLKRDRPERAAANLTRITEMAHRMGRIIRNLRAFARNKSEPLCRVDVGAVLGQAVELTGARLRADDVELIWEPPAHPIWVRGGEVRLAQVFVNLINNAADAMAGQAEKRIILTLKAGANDAGAKPSVTVRDMGPGIEEPARVFDPFYSTKAVGSSEGMGLGLSISYGLVQSFGGAIRGRNEPDGASFTVELEPWHGSEQAAA